MFGKDMFGKDMFAECVFSFRHVKQLESRLTDFDENVYLVILIKMPDIVVLVEGRQPIAAILCEDRLNETDESSQHFYLSHHRSLALRYTGLLLCLSCEQGSCGAHHVTGTQ
jgi:hypothetical protein